MSSVVLYCLCHRNGPSIIFYSTLEIFLQHISLVLDWRVVDSVYRERSIQCHAGTEQICHRPLPGEQSSKDRQYVLYFLILTYSHKYKISTQNYLNVLYIHSRMTTTSLQVDLR